MLVAVRGMDLRATEGTRDGTYVPKSYNKVSGEG